MITGFNLDIYGCSISFAVGSNKDEFAEFFEKNPSISEECQNGILDSLKTKGEAFTGPLNDFDLITVFKDKPTYRTVSHEIYHLCYIVMKERGIEDEEAWAYLIGYLTEKFYELTDDNKQEKDN